MLSLQERAEKIFKESGGEYPRALSAKKREGIFQLVAEALAADASTGGTLFTSKWIQKL